MIVVALASLLIGIALGLTSLGGFLLVPVMHSGAGLTTQEAIATTLVAMMPTGVVMLLGLRRQQHGIADGAIGIIVASIMGGLIGAGFVGLFAAQTLLVMLGMLVTVASLGGLFNLNARLGQRHLYDQNTLSKRTRFVVALFSAAVSTLTGAGGPVVSIPLMLMLGADVRSALIAAQWIAIACTTSASALNVIEGRVVFSLAWPAMALVILGIVVGIRLGRHLRPEPYRRIVAVTGLAAGLWLLSQALF